MPLPADARVRYGEAALADVLPSGLAAMGVAGERDVLGLGEARGVVVLLVDGLGWNLLRARAASAPFLSGLSGRALTAGFPTTTSVSLASLGTGLPPGEHAITGYTSRLGDDPDPVNWLSWRRAHAATPLLETYPPEQVQPHATALERGERAGLDVSVVSSHGFEGTGLTRAVLRGGTFRGVFTPADLVARVADAAALPRPLVYCYTGDLDLVGHVRGPNDPAWDLQLGLVDRVVELIAARLPAGVRLLVTADHGMVEVPDDARVDYDDDPGLKADVELIAGEARMRHVHVRAGKAAAVADRWRDTVGDRFDVVLREDAVGRGWFGPTVTPTALDRIGDVLVVAASDGAIVRSRAEPRVARMRGHHGALTDDELLVPLLQHLG
ncbi:MAG: alkaline phosphatase family protein [Jatrophihabitans sp.]|uniref:alkaline phosphatase family protein n=1 Tax=Jatrophihabitans sp. TaxID=1932789 RepID=UPI003F7FB73D